MIVNAHAQTATLNPPLPERLGAENSLPHLMGYYAFEQNNLDYASDATTHQQHQRVRGLLRDPNGLYGQAALLHNNKSLYAYPDTRSTQWTLSFGFQETNPTQHLVTLENFAKHWRSSARTTSSRGVGRL